jgi:hypothetical protein
LNYLWGMINDMSIIVLLSFVAVPIPGEASLIMQQLLSFIQLDILMTSDWLVPWVVSLDDDTESALYPEGFNYYISTGGISYVSLLKNL